MKEGSTFNERHYAASTRTEVVDVVRLDDFYDPGAPPGLIKIDVEGAEVSVLRGAKKLLSESSPVLLFESFGQGDKCQRLLAPNDYTLFDADRCGPVSGKTTNFLALVFDKASQEFVRRLRELGYPV